MPINWQVLVFLIRKEFAGCFIFVLLMVFFSASWFIILHLEAAALEGSEYVSLDIVSSIYIYSSASLMNEPYQCCALVISSLLYSSRIWCSLLVSSVWMNLQRNLLDGILSKKACLLSYILSCGLDNPYSFDTAVSRYMCRINFFYWARCKDVTTSVGSMIFEALLGKSSKKLVFYICSLYESSSFYGSFWNSQEGSINIYCYVSLVVWCIGKISSIIHSW